MTNSFKFSSIFRTALFSAVLFPAWHGGVWAQGTKLPEESSQLMLKSLTELESQLGGAKQRKMLEALKAFEAAAATGDKAYSLWADCKKMVDFDEKGKSPGEWGEYKRGDGSQYHEPEATTAFQYQLKWLCLTLRACLAEKETETAAVVGQIPAFLDSMLGDWKRMKKFSRTLRESVMTNPYARFYKLDQIVDLPETWCASPGDLDGVYSITVLPYLRTTKNLPSLQASWAKRMAQTTEIFDIEVAQEKQAENDPKAYVPKTFNPTNRRPEERLQGDAEERQIVFKREGLPRLQWGLQLDTFQLGAEISSANAMVSLIKANLGHPDAETWLKQLQALLKGEPLPLPEPAPGEAPPAAPAPAGAAPAATEAPVGTPAPAMPADPK